MRIFYKGLILIAIPLIFQVVFFVVLCGFLVNALSTVDSQIKRAERRLLSYQIISDAHGSLVLLTANAIDQQLGLVEELRARNKTIEAKISSMQDSKLSAKEQIALNTLKTEYKKFALLLDGIQQLNSANVHLSDEERIGLFALIGIRMRKLIGALEVMFEGKSTDSDIILIRERGALVDRLKTWCLIGVLASAIISGAVTFVFSHSFIRRIKHLRENSLKLAKGEQLLPSLVGRDEIAELDRVFHRVATIFRDSFEREIAMFDSAADLICCLNSRGEIERINTVFRDALGYEPGEAIGTHLSSYVEERDKEPLREFLETLRKSSGWSREREVRMIAANGAVFDYVCSVRWEPSKESYYCVAHDTTERKQLEQAKQEFVAMLSHDLRSPLTSLGITIDLVVNGAVQKMPAKCIELFVLADKSVARLVNLINELLDLEKLEAGEMEISPQVVSVESLFNSAADSLKVVASEKEVTIECVENEIYVEADEERIVRVLINLLSNAIKYSKKGGKIILSAEVTDNDMAELSVSDEGPGIPREYLDNIFERYKQIQDSQNIHKQGSGLGLSICKAIVEAHGGTIGVVSTLGRGSTFWFHLRRND